MPGCPIHANGMSGTQTAQTTRLPPRATLTQTMPTPIPEPPELPRVLTASHATSVVVGIIIGSGIFLVPREMTAAVGRTTTVYAVWIVGGLLSLFGAMTYAEIAAARPRYGGEYAFLRDAYGDLPAFLYMWTWITVAKPASLATIAAGLTRVLATFPLFAFLDTPALPHLLWSQLIDLALVAAITAITVLGTRESADLHLALTWLKVLLVLAIVACCFALGARHGATAANVHTAFPGARGGFSGFMVALVAALWAYDGWSDVTQMAGEVQRPQRNLPLALVGGVGVVAALYMLTNAAIAYILPATAIATSPRPAAGAMLLVVGPIGAALVSVGMAVSIATTFVGSFLSGARVPFAAARDGLFVRGLAHVSPRFQTPSAALALQGVLAAALVLLIGRFQALFSLAIFAEWLFYALTASTVFVFRHRAKRLTPNTPRPFSVPGYPAIPLLFLAAALVLLAATLHDQPRNSLLGLLVILAGIPIHYLYRRRHTPTL